MLVKIIIFCISALLLGTGNLSAQKTSAVETLEMMKDGLSAMQAAKFSFTFTAQNSKKERLADLGGEFIGQGQMFVLSTDVSRVYCDGQSKWILDIPNDEMTIFPHDASSTDIAENPFAVLLNADLATYNIRLQAKASHTVILTPKDKDATYTQVTITLNSGTYLPSALEYKTVNGDTYAVTIHSTESIPASDPSFFTPPSDLLADPDIYITDMR